MLKISTLRALNQLIGHIFLDITPVEISYPKVLFVIIRSHIWTLLIVSRELRGNVKYSCTSKTPFEFHTAGFKLKKSIPRATLQCSHGLDVLELTFPVQWKTPSSAVPACVLIFFCSRSLDKATMTSPQSTVKAHTLRNVPTSRLLLVHSNTRHNIGDLETYQLQSYHEKTFTFNQTTNRNYNLMSHTNTKHTNSVWKWF